MTLVQLLAAAMAGVERLVLHVGDASGRISVESALARIPDLVGATSASELTAGIEPIGLAWGVGGAD